MLNLEESDDMKVRYARLKALGDQVNELLKIQNKTPEMLLEAAKLQKEWVDEVEIYIQAYNSKNENQR